MVEIRVPGPQDPGPAFIILGGETGGKRAHEATYEQPHPRRIGAL
jgi:hypothetical protein